MVDFLILYELKNRELENVVLLGNELIRRGYSVEYCKYPTYDLHIFPGMKKKAKVVVTSALYDNHSLYMMVYRGLREVNKIVNLQWEQIWNNKANSDYTDFRFPKGLAKEAVHVCWGEHTKEKLLHSGIKENNLAITGSLQMELLNSKFSNYYLTRNELFEKYRLNYNNENILFISSFSYASLTQEEIKGLKTDLDEKTVDDFRRISIESQKKILSWFDKLLRENKDVNLIYRRHPAENNNELLRKMEENHKNFKVISELSVKQWILACDKIYTWYSTSVGEVYYAKKQCCILRPLEISEEMEVSIMNTAEKINTYIEFRKSLDQDLIFPIDSQIINSYYSFEKHRTSYERIADLLEKMLNTEDYSFKWDKKIKRGFYKKLIAERWKLPLIKLRYFILKSITKLNKKTYGNESNKFSIKLNKYKFYKEKYYKEIANEEEVKELSKKLYFYAYGEVRA